MDSPLRLRPLFWKAHGHGNDYLVFEEGEGWAAQPGNIRSVCDPHRGIGGDGIVALLGGETGSGDSSFRLRMFNPDGSEFERSGNGLRVLGAYLHSLGRVVVGEVFPVEVGGDRVEMEILRTDPGEGLEVAVEMGRARFGVEAVGGDSQAFGPGPTLSGPGGSLALHPVSVGNPHCVVFVEELGEGLLLELGPFLSTHPAFPSGVNVQLARVLGDGVVQILIWERGVGRTASSGTSACAVAAASVRVGALKPGNIRVDMEGGSFLVRVSKEFSLRLEGPVKPVLKGELAPEFLAGLGRPGVGSSWPAS